MNSHWNRHAHETREHWLSYGDCCLAVSETYPKNHSHEELRETLFFLHGRYGHGEIWRPLTTRLASHYRCLQVDFPGFGRSFSARDRGLSILEHSQLIQSLIERFAIGGRGAVLVGHDVGGAIAQLCAILSPATVQALVLINSATLTREPQNLRTGWLCFHARIMLRKLLEEGVLKLEERRLISEAWQNRMTRLSMMQAFEAWEYTWPGPIERRIWRQALGKLPLPVLLLWGRRDQLNPPENADELLRQFPDAYLFEHDECGHWPSLEALEWVHLKMREFLFQIGEKSPAWRIRTL